MAHHQPRGECSEEFLHNNLIKKLQLISFLQQSNSLSDPSSAIEVEPKLNNMSARGSNIILSKMDTQAENGLEEAKKNLSSYLMNLATQRDNSPIIANAILNKNPISTRAGAQVVNISIDLSGYVATLKTALETALRQHFTELSAARRALVDKMDTTWDPQSNTLKTKIQIDAPNENAMTAVKNSIEGIVTNGITFEPTMTVPVGPPAPPVPGVDRYMHHEPRVRYQSCIQANQEDIRRGQYKLSSAIDLILDSKTLNSLNAHIDIMSNQNEWNPDEAGQLKWARLEHLFDGKGKSTLNQIMKYVNFMKRQRKADESLSEYVAALRSAVVRLKRKNWTLNEIIAVLCYADILMSKDKTPRGIELDYSELKNDLRNSFKADKFITPSQIELKLEEIAEEAKGGNDLAIQSGKAFVGRKRKSDVLDENSGDSANDSHKALKDGVYIHSGEVNKDYKIGTAVPKYGLYEVDKEFFVETSRARNIIDNSKKANCAKKIDNESTAEKALRACYEFKNKADTKYHFIREAIELGLVDLVHVPREVNVSDMFTHPLGPTLHQQQSIEVLNEEREEKALSAVQVNQKKSPYDDLQEKMQELSVFPQNRNPFDTHRIEMAV
eukprot:g11727.t1